MKITLVASLSLLGCFISDPVHLSWVKELFGLSENMAAFCPEPNLLSIQLKRSSKDGSLEGF